MPESRVIKLEASPAGFHDNEDELVAELFDSELPVQHTKIYFHDPDIGLSVGVWDSSDMREIAGAYDCDEFMYLLSGSAQIKNNQSGLIERIDPQEAFVIAQGYDCQWIQEGYIRKFFVISEPPLGAPVTTDVKGVINLSHCLKSQLSNLKEAYNPLYHDPCNRFTAGILKSGQVDRQHDQQPLHQLIFLLSGELDIQPMRGEMRSFVAGECFFVAANSLCNWVSRGDILAFYVLVSDHVLASNPD